MHAHAQAGTLKNIVAVGAGLIEGLGYGPNTKAAVIRRGLKEMMLFSKYVQMPTTTLPAAAKNSTPNPFLHLKFQFPYTLLCTPNMIICSVLFCSHIVN